MQKNPADLPEVCSKRSTKEMLAESAVTEVDDYVDSVLHNPKQKRRVLVRDLNESLTCALCEGYLIDATAITICLHTFCRSCIVRYLESCRYCPVCEILVHKSKPLTQLRTDKSLQLLLYKLIPSVYQNEVKRRSEFYLNARASSSCSEDSILTDSEAHEQSVLSHINDRNVEFFSPDDSISLSLEYYNETDDPTGTDIEDACALLNNNNELSENQPESVRLLPISAEQHKRYLQCPAGVNIKHLTKFIRMKFGLSVQHRVDIIYEEEILPKHFTLMDVAYSFKWNRKNPMRFMYRIFESTKSPILKPIYRQQDVSIGETNESEKPSESDSQINSNTADNLTPNKTSSTSNLVKQTPKKAEHKKQNEIKTTPVKAQNEKKHGERKVNREIEEKKDEKQEPISNVESTNLSSSSNQNSEDTVEDDPEYDNLTEREREMREFAKKRDLEWANLIRESIEEKQNQPIESPKAAIVLPTIINTSNQTNLLDTNKDILESSTLSPSKKRKKSKHSSSKHNMSYSKKRRKIIHAEIQNNHANDKDDILKLKVKLTPSIHKVHKHSKQNADQVNNSKYSPLEEAMSNSTSKAQLSVVPTPQTNSSATSGSSEVSTKEKLLQMRQVRHKQIQQDKLKSQVGTVNSGSTNATSNGVSPQKKVRFNDDKVVTNGEDSADQQRKTPAYLPNLVAPKSFTVSYEKIRNEFNKEDPKTPALEIMLVNSNSANSNSTPVKNTYNNKLTSQSRLSLIQQNKLLMMKNLNLTQIINSSNKKPVLSKSVNSGMEVTAKISNNTGNSSVISAAPGAVSNASPSPGNSTIPLAKIKKLSNSNFNSNSKIDNFGALDLSSKSPNENNVPNIATTKSNDPVKIEVVTKIVQNKQNLSNLHILSESAVHIRDLMVSAAQKNIPPNNKAALNSNKSIVTSNSNNNTSTISDKSSQQIQKVSGNHKRIDNKVNSTDTNKSNSSMHPLIQQQLRIPVLQNSKSLQAQMRSLQQLAAKKSTPGQQHISSSAAVTITQNNSAASSTTKLNQIRTLPSQTVRNIPNPSAALLARHTSQVAAAAAAAAAAVSSMGSTDTTTITEVSNSGTAVSSAASIAKSLIPSITISPLPTSASSQKVANNVLSTKNGISTNSSSLQITNTLASTAQSLINSSKLSEEKKTTA